MNAILRTRPWFRVLLVVGCIAWLRPVSAARADDLKDGRTALQAGRLDEAMKAFEKSAAQGNPEGRAGVGQVFLKQRQYGKAMEAFQQAQKMDPNLGLPYYGQGEVLRRQDKCAEAVPLLQKATELDRKFPEAQLALGECLTRLNRIPEALTALSPGTKWGKWRPRFLVALGQAEMARDSLRSADIYFTQAEQEAPNDPTALKAHGDFYLKRGTFELAAQKYQAAVDKDTGDVELRFALGQALFYAQRYNDALVQYRDVVTRDPEFPPGQFALGDLYYRSGVADRRRYQDARAPLEKYTQLMADDPKGWSVLGRTYYQLGMKDEAMSAMNKAEALGDKTKEMYTLRARLAVDAKQWDKAMADYQRGEPQAEDLLRMGQVMVIQGNPARAESLYNALITQDSTSGNGKFAMSELGKLHFRQKDYPGAVAIFQRRIALDPNNDEAYYYLGLSYKELKRYPEAIGSLRHAVALADAKADRHFWLGIMLAQVDSVAAATIALKRAVELDSAGTSKNTGVALRQLGFYRLVAKDNAEAIRMLERAVAINDKDVQALVWLAQGYQNSGNRPKACENYDRALALQPDQADAIKGKKSLGC